MNLKSWINQDTKSKAGQFWTMPVELEDDRMSSIARSFLGFSAVAIFVLIVWSSLTPIRELAVAPGQLMPEGGVRLVERVNPSQQR
jgi:hypothetical protein